MRARPIRSLIDWFNCNFDYNWAIYDVLFHNFNPIGNCLPLGQECLWDNSNRMATYNVVIRYFIKGSETYSLNHINFHWVNMKGYKLWGRPLACSPIQAVVDD